MISKKITTKSFFYPDLPDPRVFRSSWPPDPNPDLQDPHPDLPDPNPDLHNSPVFDPTGSEYLFISQSDPKYKYTRSESGSTRSESGSKGPMNFLIS